MTNIVFVDPDLGGGVGLGSIALNPDNPGSGRVRAAVEAVLVRHLMTVLEARLQDVNLLSVFKEVEMPSLVTLTRMELNGFGECLIYMSCFTICVPNHREECLVLKASNLKNFESLH